MDMDLGSGALLAGSARPGAREGAWERRPRGLPAAAAAFFCLFCTRNTKYSVPLCNLPPTLSKDSLAFPLTCQPGRRSVGLFALVLQIFFRGRNRSRWECENSLKILPRQQGETGQDRRICLSASPEKRFSEKKAFLMLFGKFVEEEDYRLKVGQQDG